ncbi:uncharacterized protein LOC124205699 [Daphnia pulex]|uniref:uncharacterized protein LOC124205699 n=1 Tax=Daphnia pulex TaxID=6669 RepID=UPI001EE01A12|nr:uncharacterized protein LOC124205699 [Daphnia pulex]
MPSKKKKYNARFPPARIKKIMQTDEEVGKVAAPVPVIISRALELFVESLLTKAVQITSARNAKTLSPAHLKQCILAESRFDFLKDLVLTIPDVQAEGEDGGVTSVPSTPTVQQHQPLMFRSLSEAGSSSSTSKSKGTGTGRPRGRPRKTPAALAPAQNNQRAWAARKSDSEETDSGDSEDDDDDENNSTDTESLPKGSSSSKNGRDIASATAQQASFQFNAVQPNFYQEIGGQNNSSFQIQINLPPQTAPIQERIKDLNMQARQFASAVTAIQTNNSSRANGVSGRSLQVTPWGSPRLLSPVEVRHIPEYVEADPYNSPGSSPSRYRWCRTGSLKTPHKVGLDIGEDTKLKELEQLWFNDKDNIIQNLPDLLSNNQREITLQEAQNLAAVLASNETPLILGTLTAVANLAAFSTNQDHFREAGLITVLSKLILKSNRQIKLKSCVVVANMAMNEKNNADMRSVTISLVHLLQTTPLSDPALITSTLLTLINIAVMPSWHKEFKPLLHKSYNLLDEGHWNSDGVSFQSLRLLINLSCNEEMIPSLLAAQAPSKLIYMLDMSMPEEVVLRVLTLLANLASATKRLDIDPLDLPAENKAAAPDTMYANVFGLSMVERFKKKAKILSERHSNSDVCVQASRLLEALSE